MNKWHITLAGMLLLLFSSCVSRNFRAVAAWGQRFECVATPASMDKLREGYTARENSSYDTAPTLYRVRDAYYVAAVRTHLEKDYGSFPIVGLGFEGEPLGLPKPRYRYVDGAEEERGYCRVERNKKGVGWHLVTEGADVWLTELPIDAVPTRRGRKEKLFTFARCPGVKHNFSAVFAYPLSFVTLVAVDTPCYIVGNVLVWTVMGPTLILEEFARSAAKP